MYDDVTVSLAPRCPVGMVRWGCGGMVRWGCGGARGFKVKGLGFSLGFSLGFRLKAKA